MEFTDLQKAVGRAKNRPNKQKSSRRAAIYVRMSTDLQKYCTENQIAVAAAYAKEHGLKIDRAYVDEGKGGLGVKGLDALKTMLFDVQSMTTNYDVILMLDMTRWGKFQDAPTYSDYEAMCQSAGIEVRYVMPPPVTFPPQNYSLGIPSFFERQDCAK